MMDTNDLIRKASAGTIRDSEILAVYKALEEGQGDCYDLLLIIGKAGKIAYRNTIEQYLDSPADPMLARVALQILCRYWKLAKDYESDIIRFLDKVDWDDEQDVRLMAIGCAGELLKSDISIDVLRRVYSIFRDSSEDMLFREAAYESLALAAGREAKDLSQPLHFNFDSDVDSSVIDFVEKSLSA